MNIRKSMKRRSIVSVALAFLSVGSAFAQGWTANVTSIRPGGDRNCTLFQLVGVSTADPVTPNDPWFVIESTAPQYNQMVATLLAAKATGQNIQVLTTGQTSATCGHATVSVILWP